MSTRAKNSRLVEPLGVAGIDRRVVMHAEAGMAPGQEQVDALLGDELPVSEKTQHLVTEDELGLMGIDVGNGRPRTVIEENRNQLISLRDVLKNITVTRSKFLQQHTNLIHTHMRMMTLMFVICNTLSGHWELIVKCILVVFKNISVVGSMEILEKQH